MAALIRYLDGELAHHPRSALPPRRVAADLTARIRDRLAPGDVFIDVGAHTGHYTLLASRQVGAYGRVVAIEASPAFHTSVTEAAHRNACRNVRTVNVAAADTARTSTLYLQDAANLGNTSAVRPNATAASPAEDRPGLPSFGGRQPLRSCGD